MLGLFAKLLREFKNTDDFGLYSKNLIKERPDLKVVATNFGTKVGVTLVDPVLVKEVLQNQQRYKKGNFFGVLNLIWKRSILMAQGEEWKSSRRLMSKVFSFEHLQKLIPSIQRLTNETLTELKTQSIGKEIDSLELFRNLIGSIFAEFFFGAHVKKHSMEGKTIPVYFAEMITGHSMASVTPLALTFGSTAVKYGLTSFYRSINRQASIFRRYALDIIREKREAFNNRSKGDESHQIDLLDIFFECQESIGNLSDEDLVDNFVAFFAAGTDTSAHLLQTVMYYLDRFPEYKKMLRDEINNVITDATQNITLEQINRLEFTNAVLKETLRMVPPFSQLMQREALFDHHIRDFLIRKGSLVSVDILALHHHPKRFENPARFNPFRWVKGHPDFNEEMSKDPYLYLPFSAGPRNCIGQPLAMLEMKIILALFARQFEWKVKEGYKLRLIIKFGYEPMESVPIVLEPLH